jgi:hypothetical protein
MVTTLLTPQEMSVHMRNYMKLQGLSSEDVSRKLGFRTSAGLNRVISGRWLMPPRCIPAVSEFFKIDLLTLTCSVLWHRSKMPRVDFLKILEIVLQGGQTSGKDQGTNTPKVMLSGSTDFWWILPGALVLSIANWADLWTSLGLSMLRASAFAEQRSVVS